MPRATPLLPKANMSKRRTKQPTLRILCMMTRPAAGAAHGVHSAEATDLQGNANAGELFRVQLQARGGGRSSGWQWELVCRWQDTACWVVSQVTWVTDEACEPGAYVTAHLLHADCFTPALVGQHVGKTAAQ